MEKRKRILLSVDESMFDLLKIYANSKKLLRSELLRQIIFFWYKNNQDEIKSSANQVKQVLKKNFIINQKM
jgi:hypothetical protein